VADVETLVGDPPVTESGQVGLVMLHVSGTDGDVQWFDYRPGFFSDIIRVEWDKDTMAAVIPADVADLLVRQGYARIMTEVEAENYNSSLAAPEPEPEPKSKRKPRKETSDGEGIV
jgi:hypothetical protein